MFSLGYEGSKDDGWTGDVLGNGAFTFATAIVDDNYMSAQLGVFVAESSLFWPMYTSREWKKKSTFTLPEKTGVV